MPRCNCCKRKISPGADFICKCKQMFCVYCRHPETHKCGIEFEKVKLEKVVAPKIDKI